MNSGLRITHIIGGGEFGGAEEHILQLLQELKNHHINAHVICFYDSLFAQRLRQENIEVDVLTYGRFDVRIYFGLVKILKEKKSDIVHTHGVKANFFGRLAARKANISPVVTTVHSLLKYDYENTLARYVVQHMEKSTRNRTDHFIAISDTIKDQLIEDGIKSSKVVVVQHGIDTQHFAPKEDQKANQLAISWGKKSNDQFLIGAIGRLKTVKGFAYYLDACASLHQKNPEKYRFVIVGEGPEREKLEQLVEKHKLADVFTFVGFSSDVASCLRAFDCYVSSSLSEGLGLAVMEALSTGTPVVATAVGGVVDFARDQENALLIPAKSADQIVDAVLQFVDNKELADRLSTQAVIDMQAHFSVNRMGRQTAEFYQKWKNQND